VWRETSHELLIEKFKGKIAQLCVQKYASNMIEKCMHFDYLREKMLPEILSEEKLKLIVNSAYGCYVIKSAAQYGSNQLKQKMRAIINNISNQLHQKKIKTKWQEIQNILNA